MLRHSLCVLLLATTACTASAQDRPRAVIKPVVETDGVRPGRPARVALVVTLPKNLHVQSSRPRDANLIPTVLTIHALAGVSLSHIVYPQAMDFPQEGQSQPLSVFPHEFVAGAELAIGADVPPGDLVVRGSLRYQACDERACFGPLTAPVEWTLKVVSANARITEINREVFAGLAAGQRVDAATIAASAPAPAPSTAAVAPSSAGGVGVFARLDRFTVLSTTGGYLGSADFLKFIKDAESGVVAKGMLEGRGPLAILAIILLGGFALNLTPCVLPMIPINLAIIGAGAQAGSRRRGFLLGSTYGGAMALVYGVLGLVVILTAGTFGTLNASPWFNFGIAALFVVLGLAMFEVILIDFSRFSSSFRPTGRGTFALAFTMGGVAALLAGACVAPVVIQVVLFSSSLYAGGTTLALALPFVLGLGMALPWPIAGAGLAALPKPGKWMVRVTQAFGVLILATAVYYGYLGYTLLANRWVDPSAVSGSVTEKLKEGWYSSLDEGLLVAERDQKPVLIDFWATWCKNCLTMDQTTLVNADVKAALAGYVKIKYQAEDPDVEPAKSIMARFKAVGLPTYVILRPATAAPRTGSGGVSGGALAAGAPVPGVVVSDVRQAIARNEIGRATTALSSYRAAQGVTPEWLVALSWLARGELATAQLANAESHAKETYEMATAMLTSRSLDQEPSLPIALGAAIEVMAKVRAQRGATAEALAFLHRERATYAGTSIEIRIHRNINLLSLEGTTAPPLDLAEHLGPTPPTLGQLKGKVVVLFFWAHWCADCKAQAPLLERLTATYKRQGLAILAPTQHFGYVAGGQIASAADEARYIDEVRRQFYPVLAGQPVPLAAANYIRYGVSSTPTLVILDRAGIVRAYHPGRMTWEELVAAVEPLLVQTS
jgi:thiol:disulfide interchange protein DsbD